MDRPRYALVAYDAWEQEYGATWALCGDVEGLFADPPPPVRERYELLGCAPEGELSAAVALACSEGSAPIGPLTLELLDKAGRSVGEWCLQDVRILGARRCARDLTLLDVSLEGTPVPDEPDYPQRPPLSPGFCLFGTEPRDTTRELPWGTARDLACVHEDPPTQQDTAVRLLGCTPQNALRRALDRGEEDLGTAVLRRLDRFGAPVQDAVEGEVTAWIPSARGPGGGQVDLTLQPLAERPPSAAHDVWELWADGRPGMPDLWARCDGPGRSFWLTTALINRAHTAGDAAPGTTFHLDGRHITDEPAFFCALGEAVNGPGGYFGWGLDALADCLCGHFGARRPFTLVWHDAHIARRCLGVQPRTDVRPRTFEELLAFLTERDVEVVLA
ncbi:barstar family protein [Streptomyces cavernicola]|uniref:Barstar family protein n=1 Tax=Streptomyces cavernicola TaxID=3043613 RepID=A0ABT6SHG5_9ACTN|nr:barstar family protein [Streptomyces sp. B-S-A6]MDI3407641.1 barstar family protein [Streptomyces sp. B-S-A6]